MTKKWLTLILIVSLLSCRNEDQVLQKYKKGLLDFSVHKSTLLQQPADTTNDKSHGFGSLWTHFNKINAKTVGDTLYVDVNTGLSATLKYEGGIEFAGDTLFLYAKCLDKELKRIIQHSTLSYKIDAKGQGFKEIEFKELN
jgi:hypothetical protein